MYYYKPDYSQEQTFWFPKIWIESGAWSALYKAGKAALPVICSHCNRDDGVAYPGLLRTAILSGLSRKQAGKGVKALHDFPGIKIEQRWTSRGKQSKKFIIDLPQKGGFPFYTSIFHSGIWYHLPSIAKAIYPVLRCYKGFFDDFTLEEFAAYVDPDCEVDDLKQVFANREWELCGESKTFIGKMAGIHRSKVNEAIEHLKHNKLIVPPVEEYFGENLTVQVKPTVYYPK